MDYQLVFTDFGRTELTNVVPGAQGFPLQLRVDDFVCEAPPQHVDVAGALAFGRIPFGGDRYYIHELLGLSEHEEDIFFQQLETQPSGFDLGNNVLHLFLPSSDGEVPSANLRKNEYGLVVADYVTARGKWMQAPYLYVSANISAFISPDRPLGALEASLAVAVLYAAKFSIGVIKVHSSDRFISFPVELLFARAGLILDANPEVVND